MKPPFHSCFESNRKSDISNSLFLVIVSSPLQLYFLLRGEVYVRGETTLFQHENILIRGNKNYIPSKSIKSYIWDL